jgi:hypothetical protein
MKKTVKAAKPAAPKVKKPRGHSVAAIKLGGEPQLLAPDNIQLAQALNWYNRVADNKEMRIKWVVEYMTNEKYSADDIANFKKRGKKFLGTFSALARMINNGCALDDKYHEQVNAELKKFLGTKDTEDEESFDEEGNLIVKETEKKVVVKKDKTQALANALVEYIDGEMDKVLAGEKVGSLYESLSNKGITPAAARELKAFYKPQAFEFYELNAGKDAQLNEGYAHLTKKIRKAICDWMLALVADLSTLETNKKVTRTPRKKRKPKAENLVKRMKHAKDSLEFKVKSIDAQTIIGAKALWVFNTKTRQVGCYYAETDEGFSVKGTTITNAKGEMKKLRKAEEFLAGFSGTQKALEQKYKAVKTAVAAMNGRINQHIILLRVF